FAGLRALLAPPEKRRALVETAGRWSLLVSERNDDAEAVARTLLRRYVAGFGGEQFAAPDAVGRLRAVRRMEALDELVVLSAADPLNLVGILTPQPRIASVYRNRVLLKDGVPIAALEGGEVRRLAESAFDDEHLKSLLARRSLRTALKPHLRLPTASEARALARVVH